MLQQISFPQSLEIVSSTPSAIAGRDSFCREIPSALLAEMFSLAHREVGYLKGLGFSGTGDGIHGLAGVSLNTVRASESLWVEAPCKHVELFYLKQPDGGGIDIMLDGKSVLEKPLTTLSRNLVPAYFRF